MNADFHMHTNFSTDAVVSPEEMIKGAIDKGLHVICFTDHQDADFPSGEYQFRFDTKEYFEKMKQLQKQYKDDIDIRIGVEIGLQSHLGAYYKQYISEYPFDFVIGSVHAVGGLDPYEKQLFWGRTDTEVYEQAFVETLVNIKAIDDFDVLGHIDYVVRYGTYQAKEYTYSKFAFDIDSILKYLIEHGKGIELNTSGFKYGLGFCHPHPEIIKRYQELGGEIITVGADAHKPEHIAFDFKKVKEILKQCGFKYYTEFKDRKPIFKQLV
ncbi:histidinol-phosphatase HisJ family protein [Lachnospiraceae bacterium LCP25S3_G4]